MSIGKCSAHEIHVCMATSSLTNQYMNIWGSILVAQHDTNCCQGNCIPEKYGKMMCSKFKKEYLKALFWASIPLFV